MSHRISSALLIVLLLNACVYGPKTERKSALSALNGENYETSPQGPNYVVVPIVKARERLTHLQGTVLVADGEFEVPLRFVAVGVLSTDGRRLAEATTDSDGKFEINAVLHNGAYSLQVLSPKYSGERSFSIESYDVSGLVIRAKTKP